jgi:HTH-type transcriptional regulator / antitoxin HigA
MTEIPEPTGNHMRASAIDIAKLAPAWRAFASPAPVPLHAIANRRHYAAMGRFMESLLDEVGDDEAHPLCGLLDVVPGLVRDYEKQNVPMPESSPAETLRWLMDQHKLRQVDLAELFDAQSKSVMC